MRLFVRHLDRTLIVVLPDDATMDDLVEKCKAKFDLKECSLSLDVEKLPHIQNIEEVRDGDRVCIDDEDQPKKKKRCTEKLDGQPKIYSIACEYIEKVFGDPNSSDILTIECLQQRQST